MAEGKPLSETITDAEIASILGEYNLDPTAKNIDFVRDTHRITEKYLKQLEEGRLADKILTEIQLNALRKN